MGRNSSVSKRKPQPVKVKPLSKDDARPIVGGGAHTPAGPQGKTADRVVVPKTKVADAAIVEQFYSNDSLGG